jgi:hypothetical protein
MSAKSGLKRDAGFAALAAALAGVIYFVYMAPTVAFSYSGEIVTAAYTFGVPHPPGHPIWALGGFLWSHLVLPFGNPAWRIGMFSVVTGAMLTGVMALLTIRAVRVLLNALPWNEALDEPTQNRIAVCVGLSTALLFGFTHAAWSQACVPNERELTTLFHVIMACAFLAWMAQPERRFFLYLSALLFGMGLTECQSIAWMVIPFAAGLLVFGLGQYKLALKNQPEGRRPFGVMMTALGPFWEMVAAGLLCVMIIELIKGWGLGFNQQDLFKESYVSDWRLRIGFYACSAVLVIIVGYRRGWWSARRILAVAGLVLAGTAFCLYIPLAAATNPPMNWGHAVTKTEFFRILWESYYHCWWHDLFGESILIKSKTCALALVDQYSPELVLVGLATLLVLMIGWPLLKPRGRGLLVFGWTAFLTLSAQLAPYCYSETLEDIRLLKEHLGPAHAYYAVLIGLGIAAILSLLAGRGPRGSGVAARYVCLGLLALPLIAFWRNWPECAYLGNGLAYRFGRLMFEPGGGYPAMEKNAILFGGTDSGRFVPTYLIFCESPSTPANKFGDKQFDRSDVFIIAQNALLNSIYMRGLCAQYEFSRPKNDLFLQRLLGRGHIYPQDPIRIPSAEEVNQLFIHYFRDIRSGKIPPTGGKPTVTNVTVTSGAVTGCAVSGVMGGYDMIARWIVEKNKAKHAFYVEECYVIAWMHPYLRPAGIIMKLENEPLPSPQDNPQLWREIVERDRAYWDKLSAELLARKEFCRDWEARNSFSKLRCALAGLYAFWGLAAEAEYAFKQAILLQPASAEANFRLAQLFLDASRYPEAHAVMRAYQKLDPARSGVKSFLDEIQRLEDAKRGDPTNK